MKSVMLVLIFAILATLLISCAITKPDQTIEEILGLVLEKEQKEQKDEEELLFDDLFEGGVSLDSLLKEEEKDTLEEDVLPLLFEVDEDTLEDERLDDLFKKEELDEVIIEALFKEEKDRPIQTYKWYQAELNKVQEMPGPNPFPVGTRVVLEIYSSGGSEKAVTGRDPDLWQERYFAAKEKCDEWGLQVVDVDYRLGIAGKRGVAIKSAIIYEEINHLYQSPASTQDTTNLAELEKSIKQTKKDLFDFKLDMVSRVVPHYEYRIQNLEEADSVQQILNEASAETKSSVVQESDRYNWLLIAGWHGTTFGEQRDLSTPMAGIRFGYKSYFIQILGGINPWSSGPGYAGHWYRDGLGTAALGYDFYKIGKRALNIRWNMNIQIGGLIGWEFTSETNEFDLQVLGLLTGLGLELKVARNTSIGISLNYVHAETSDVTIETGKMRNGVYFSAFLKIF